MTSQAQKFMYGIVIEAPDSGTTSPRSLGFEIQHLPDRAALPEETPVKPLTAIAQR